MTFWVDIFTILGSILGAIAFFQNLFKPLMEYNIKRWEFIKVHYISDINFKNMQLSVGSSNLFQDYDLDKLNSFVYAIKDNLEGIRFKSFLNKAYDNLLNEIVKKYEELREYVQVPWWQPTSAKIWLINKELFYRDAEKSGRNEDFVKADKEYRNHLAKVDDLLSEIYQCFNRIGILANRTLLEWVWPLKKNA